MERAAKKELFQRLQLEAKDIIDSTEEMDQVYRKIVKLLDTNIPYYNWTGFYMVEQGQLVLGYYLGKPTEHLTIQFGEGICGQAAERKESFIVADVSKEDNYLACSLETASEIVVPIMKGDRVLGEIDIDSDQPGAFDALDQHLLEAIAAMLAARL